MQGKNLSEKIRELATDDKVRSETSRLRDVFDDIEAALSAGVTRAAVLQTLHEEGFKMTEASFKSALQRIRKQRSTQSKTIGNKPESKSVSKPLQPKEKELISESDSSKHLANQVETTPAKLAGVSEFQKQLEAPIEKMSYKAILAQQQKEDNK